MLNTGSLASFIDLGDTDINTLNFEKKEDFATHALVYFVRGVFFFKFKEHFIGVFSAQSNIYAGAL